MKIVLLMQSDFTDADADAHNTIHWCTHYTLHNAIWISVIKKHMAYFELLKHTASFGWDLIETAFYWK